MAPHERVIHIAYLECATAREALACAQAAWHGVAIRIAGKNLVTRQEDADRLAAFGAAFAYLSERDGRILTVPVNG
jgi:hypothetical protein